MTAEPQVGAQQHGERQIATSPALDGDPALFPRDNSALNTHHDFETDMFQWPFIDASWSAGFDTGLDGLWHNSGLFDHNTSLR